MMYKYNDDQIVEAYITMPEGVLDLYFEDDYEAACYYISKLLHVRLGIARDIVHSVIPYFIQRFSDPSDPRPFVPSAAYLLVLARRALERGNKVYLLWQSLDQIKEANEDGEIDPKYLQIWKGHSDIDFSFMIWDCIRNPLDKRIAWMKAAGFRYGEIAAQMHISVYKVFQALQRVYRILKALRY